MSLEYLSRPFTLQAFEELLQAIPACSVAETSSAPPESVDGVAAAVGSMSLSDSQSFVSRILSFLHECSNHGLLIEGSLAVAAASIDRPLWHTPLDGPNFEFSSNDVVANVRKEGIEVLKSAGATSEQSALTLPTLGRKLSGGVGLKLPKDQKLRSVLQNIPGIAFCGDSTSRSGPSVYLVPPEAAAAAAPCEGLPSDHDSMSSPTGAIERLRKNSDLVAAVCALLHLWSESPDTVSELHKTCKDLQLHPKACVDAVQRTNALLSAFLLIDRSRLPESIFLKGLEPISLSQSSVVSQSCIQIYAFKFSPVVDVQHLRSRAAAFARRDFAGASALCDIAAKHFSAQMFQIFSAFGQIKCRLLCSDGSTLPSSVPLKASLQGFESRFGFYMGTPFSAADGCISISCATSNPLIVSRFPPLRTEIMHAPALAIDKLQEALSLQSTPGCIVSRTSRMEISVHGPDAQVAEACARIHAALAAVTPQLIAVPLVLGDETGMVEANHRAIFGRGFQAACVLSATESNTIEISNVGHYLSVETGKDRFSRSGCSLPEIKKAFKDVCLDKLFPLPHSENHPFDFEAHDRNGELTISVSFVSGTAAQAACALFSRIPNFSLLQMTQARPDVAKNELNAAFRVTFCISNIENLTKNEHVTAEGEIVSAVKETSVADQKYYAVNMKCCNKSAWHRDVGPIDPDRPPVQVRIEDFPRHRYGGHGNRAGHVPDYDAALREEQRHRIGRSLVKSAFSTHHALRRTKPRIQKAAASRIGESMLHPPAYIPNEVFAHSGHRCLHSEDCACPVVDGPHRSTFDHLPRWSCCNEPAVHVEDRGVFCNARPRPPFDSFAPSDLCHYCWETHFFLSRADADEAAASEGALEYRRKVSDYQKNKKLKEAKKAKVTRAPDVQGSALQSSVLMSRLKGRSLQENRYVLSFSDAHCADQAVKCITHSRRLDFSLKKTEPGEDPCLYSLTDVQCFGSIVAFNLRSEIHHQQRRNSCEENVPLPNRHLLLGVLKHWGCEGITGLHVLPSVPISAAFLKGAMQIAAHDLEAALATILVPSSPEGSAAAQGPAALSSELSLTSEFSSSQAQVHVPAPEFSVLCEPIRLSPAGAYNFDHPPTFEGIRGWQMLSFLVRMRSQESLLAALPDIQKALLGSTMSKRDKDVCEGFIFDKVCCEIHPDNSKCVLLPPDAGESFLAALYFKITQIVSQAPKSVLDCIIESPFDAPHLPKSNRLRLVLASSEDGLVDHVLGLIWCFVYGIRFELPKSLVWWLHSEQGVAFFEGLRCDSAVCVTVKSSGTVAFHGDYDACQTMLGMLKNALSEVQHEEENVAEEGIIVTLLQLNQFVKRHGSLRAAVTAFAPHVQRIRAANIDGKWRLVVTASPVGLCSVRDDVLVAQVPAEQGREKPRYQCLICDEGSDTLGDDWLVSLACGCILHLPCARFYYSSDDPLRPNCLYPLECFGLKASGKKCGAPLAQLDIKQLVQDPVQLQKRVTEELSRFASIPSSDYRMCPVPHQDVQCKMLYRRASSTQSWSTRVCEGCGFQHCAACEGAPHAHGMSCREAGGDKVSEDPFANLDPSRYGRCPRCALFVERAEACNHMVCTRCNNSFYLKQ